MKNLKGLNKTKSEINEAMYFLQTLGCLDNVSNEERKQIIGSLNKIALTAIRDIEVTKKESI